MTVKFDHEHYKVSIKSYFKIEYLKLLMWFRRIKGWTRLLKVADVCFIFVLFFVWGLAGVLFSKIDGTSITSCLIEEKAEIFSSVIIVFFFTLFDRVKDYNKINKNQFWLYVMLRDSFDELYFPFLGRMSGYYLPFYCDNTLQETMKLVHDSDVPYPGTEMDQLIDNISKKIELVKSYNDKGEINHSERYQLQIEIEACERELYIISNDYSGCIKEHLLKLMLSATILIDSIRSVWIRERDLFIGICENLMKEGYSFLEDFYSRMYFYSLEEIEDFEKENGSFEDEIDPDIRSTMMLIGYEVPDDFDIDQFAKEYEIPKSCRNRLFRR